MGAIFASLTLFGLIISQISPASSPEWVEIYNPDDSQISLNDTSIHFNPDLTHYQKYIFCSGDFVTAKSYKRINADNWLANTGDTISLKRGDDVIDSVLYGSGGVVKAPFATQSAIKVNGIWEIGAPNLRGEQANFSCPTPTPSVTPTPTVVEVASVEVKISLDSQKYLDEEFAVKIEAKNLSSSSQYYAKLRGGLEESKLTKARTKNGNSWLSDSESWSSFPVITADNSGRWMGEIKGMVDKEKETGKYKFLVRFRKIDTESNFDSQIKELEIIMIKPTPSPTLIPTPILTVTKIPTPVVSLVTTSSLSAVLAASTSANSVDIPNLILEKKESVNPLMIIGGSALIFTALMCWVIVKYGHDT